MMLFYVLFVPSAMIAAGFFLWKHPTANPNGIIGYRTSYSMKNKDTWVFAQEHSGKAWVKWGCVMWVLSAAAALFLSNAALAASGVIAIAFMAIQLLVMLVSFIPTEIALRRTFDENGVRKEQAS